SWESLEHAGYDPFTYDGAIGVYAGMGLSRYLLRNLLGNPDVSDADSPMLLMGNDKDFLATRVSYQLNLRGPSLAVQTGCSTSLVATHLAVDALLSYQCDLALVGGATVTPPQLTGYLRMPGSTASPDGHSRAFDAEAAGTVFGNGVAAVVLKRLPEAVADRDTIHAVIKGSAVNNDGAGKVGFAAPGISGQAEVIVRAQRGHGQIPASLHFKTPNPEIDFERSPFYVNTELRVWPRGATPRRAGVSAFGFGGTNAHVVLEEPPRRAPTPAGARPQVLMLSAKTADALEHATNRLADQLRDHPEQSLADVAYTTQVGRARFAHRRSVVCRDLEDAVELLSAPGDPRWRKLREARQGRTVAFMFSGVGDQYVGMAQDLYEDEPVFAAAVDECAESLRPHLGIDLRDVLYPERGAPRAEGPRARGRLDMAGMFSGAPPEDELRATTLAYPAVFCVEYALARQLTAWGVRPAALIGHSLGEYVAATVAGVFTLHDALRLIVHRARLIDQLPGGAMLAVSLSPDALRPRLTGSGLSIALLNGPRLTVVAGPSEAVDALARELSAEEIACRPLGT
ncbi:type I polyketide synthase, partial [Streptomyces sp. MCAF7]